MKLKDKVAIVTGGSRGIGAAISCAYAKEGAIVIIANKNLSAGVETANKIKQEGGRAEAIVCDVTEVNSIKNLIDHVIKKYGQIDILVNNAGIAIFKKIENQTLEDWDVVINTNLKGAFFMTQAVIPHMKKRKYGKIIFVASVAGSIGFATIAPYSASKGGMIAMANTMVAELAEYNININTISPGNTATSINQHLWSDPEFVAKMAEKTPSKRAYMKPEDMAGAAVFLASDDAKAVQGLDLKVDEGWCAI